MKTIASKQFRSVVFTLITLELANAIACMIDGFTIGHFMGNETMAAYGLAAPYFSLIAILSGTLTVSMQVLVSRNLGQGDIKKANDVFNTLFFLGIAIGVLVTVLGFVFSKQVAMVFGARGEYINLLDGTKKALMGYFLGAGLNIIFCILTPILQFDGKQKMVNAAGVVSAITDIVLDLLNVFVFKLGIFGIALATTISFLVPDIMLFTYFLSKKKTFSIDVKMINMKDAWKYIREGLPRGIAMAARLVGPVISNAIVLATAFTSGMAAMSVLGSIKFLAGAPGWGIAGTVLLLAGVSLGEKDKQGLINTMMRSFKYVFFLIVGLTIIIEILAGPIARAYITDSDEALTMAIHAIRWYAAALPFIALNNNAANYLQAIGNKVGTYLYSIGNEFAAYVIVLFIMAKTFGVEGIWAAMLVEQILLLVTYVVCAFTRKTTLKGREKLLLLKSDFDANIKDFIQTNISTKDEACELSEKVMELCKSHNIDDKKGYYLGLCLEELANNVLQHGFSDGKPHRLEVRVVVDEGDVVLRMCDDCKAFDINKYLADLRMEETDFGKGIGLRLVMKAAKEVNYTYTLNTNYIMVKI